MPRDRRKKPKFGATPPARGPRPGEDPDSSNARRPVWSISIFDTDGPWGRSRCENDPTLWDSVLPKLKNYETMTWAEIIANKKRDHSVSVESLIKAARDRLTALSLEDIDEIFRFRLSGAERLWGIRDREIFRVLWWDPGHEICPSTPQ